MFLNQLMHLSPMALTEMWLTDLSSHYDGPQGLYTS